MNASFIDRLECRYYLRLDLIRLAKVMLFTLAFIWIVNIVVLVTSPIVSTKSTPCFTDGDCPSALEKCVYGSWKGLGNCHRKTREAAGDLRKILLSDRRNAFRSRRLVRRKRNPSNIWNDSYLSQKRWDVWLPTKQQTEATNQHSNAGFRQKAATERFDEIAADLLNFGRSYVAFKGVNYTVAVTPSGKGTSDWLLTLARDDYDTDQKRIEHVSRERLMTNRILQKRQRASADFQAKAASILLENSFGSSGTAAAAVNISVRYPVKALWRQGYGGGSGIRFRFRRQLPGRLMDLDSIDPLINHVTRVEPVVPSAEDIFGKNIGKRSTHSKKEMQRIRREFEEIEDDVAPLPKVIKGPDEGPIIIEDLFNDNGRTSTLRKRRHEVANVDSLIHNQVTRHKRHHKTKEKTMSLTDTGSGSLLGRSQQIQKRKPFQSASLLGTRRKDRSYYAEKHPRATMKQRAKTQVLKRKVVKRSHKNTGQTTRKTVAGSPSKDRKRSDGGASGGNTTLSGTTEPPDPFSNLKNTKEPHIDYYDVSKRNLLKDEEDMDPESSLDDDDSESSPDEDDSEIDNIQEEETRRKRQTLAEELEDDDEQDIPSWREAVDLLRQANTFAVPAHDSSGHVVLVRRVRDLGALDLGESLVKLKETMAKIFGRCSPARRRKRSHRALSEVVTDQLSNEETWEIQGEGHEVMDQAKIDVHMDDDKVYNVTTVLRPMGKRSYNHDRKSKQANAVQQTKMGLRSGTSREMRDILEQNARIDEIPHIRRLEKNLNEPGLKNVERITRGNGRLAYTKRNDEKIPLNKDVHVEAQEGSPVEIDLTVDEQQGAAQPVAEVQANTLSTAQSKTAISKRNQHQQSAFASRGLLSKTGQSPTHLMSRNPSSSPRGSLPSSGSETIRGNMIRKARRGHHEKCIGCKTFSQFAPNMGFGEHSGRKSVREPYVITRKYNDSKTRPARVEGGDRKTRQLSDTDGLDRADLLYLADGDSQASSWRAPPANTKRDVDVQVEVEGTGNDTESDTTTTAGPSVTVKVTIEEEKDGEIFSGNSSAKSGKRPSSLEARASVTSEREIVNPSETASIILGGRVSADSPVQTQVINLSPPRPKSVLTVASGDSSPAIEETITSGDLDWGISGSSDRLMALISGIEKALRVPLGGSDSGVDRVTVVDDGSNAVQTQVVSSQPEITEQKTSYTYSVNEPQPPLIVTTTTQEKKPDVVKMDVTTGKGAVVANTEDLHENIYLKGFEVPRKPAKPLFVDAAAKKMIWVEPSYKTVVSSGFPKYKLPLSYLRLYNGAVPRIKPVDQWTQVTNIQNLDSNTIGDVKIGNDKPVTVEKFEDQTSGAAITGIRASKTTEILQPPRLFGVQKNILLSGQLMDNVPPPERDRDTVVKVVSSVSSNDPDLHKATILSTSPTVAVHMDDQDDASGTIESRDLPSNIRILHEERDSDGKIIATIGSRNNLKKKKDLQEFSDTSQIPFKHARLLSSNGVILSENRLNTVMKDAAPMQIPGDKRNAHHIYRVPNTNNKETLKRRVKTKGVTATSKRASANPAQAAPVVHKYSKDPGVQGATMSMMNDLVSRLASQNAQRKISQTSYRRNAACAGGIGNCRRKRHDRRDGTSPGNIHSYDMSPKSQQLLGPGIMVTRQIRKRDVSRTVFEQPKVFIVSPKTIFEAPGTKYKFIDPQERNNVTKHLKIYTISNTSSDAGNKAPVEKPPASGASTSDNAEQFSHNSASSLPMSHEKALQEAESQERYKIVDSVEGFSVEAPSFDKKVTSGGQLSEDRMVPVPLEVDRAELPHDERRIAVTTDVERHKHRPRLKISATETADSGSSPQKSQQKTQTVEFVHSAETGPDGDGHEAKVMRLPEGHYAPNTRKKRRSPNTETNNRRSREEKIQTLRKELQNLNNIGSKLGLNFFDRSSIDRIVREVSHQGREEMRHRETSKNRLAEIRSTKHKRKRKIPQIMADSKVKNTGHIPFRNGNKMNVSKRRTKHASNFDGRYSAPGETVSSKSIEGRGNGKSYSHAKIKRNDHRSKGHDRRRNALKHSQHELPSKRTMRSSNKHPTSVEIDTLDNADVEVAPSYHYSNEVRNDDPLVISNPENHDSSNNRQREEALTVSNKESEPMEITAVLRGRRKKREIKPDEFFHFSRAEPLYRRSVGSRVAAPSSPALTGQWQKQFAPARLHSGGDESKSGEATPAMRMRNELFDEMNQRSSGGQNGFNSQRATVPRRPEQQAVSEANSQRTANTGMDKRQQLINAFPSQKNFGLQSRHIAREPFKIAKNIDNKDTAGHGVNDMLNSNMPKRVINQGPSKPVRTERINPKGTPSRTSNATNLEPLARKSKGPELGVWKKLGEIFDIGPKETLRPDTETTVPATPSPAPPQAMVPDEETVHPAPVPSGRTAGRGNPRKPSSRPESSEERVKSGLRAAIVDRLLQDLRKMASARGSEMARAESDLIEILHDYQTDLMDEDEKTIAGEPFQGVRIHDNMAIPVVYQAVPIKMESLSQHRLVVRSSNYRPARGRPSSWDPAAPYNPP